MSIFRQYKRLQLRKAGQLGVKYKTPQEIKATQERIKEERIAAKYRNKRNATFPKRSKAVRHAHKKNNGGDK